MKIRNENTDGAILGELGERLGQARLMRNLTQEDFAMANGLSKRTVERMEAGGSVQLSSLIRALRALGLLENLDQLIPEAGPSPLAQLKLKKKERHRASFPRGAAPAPSDWTWGEGK
jgi:transcriptional regulator with XRE-family HTH domain